MIELKDVFGVDEDEEFGISISGTPSIYFRVHNGELQIKIGNEFKTDNGFVSTLFSVGDLPFLTVIRLKNLN